LPEALQPRVSTKKCKLDITRITGYKPKRDANGQFYEEEVYGVKYEGDFIVDWDKLTPEQRKEHVRQNDYKNGPALAGERLIGWYDYTMDARRWWDMQNVTPEEAAKVLCRLNPLECEDPDGIYVDGDSESPRRYKTMLRVFEDVASTIPKPRTLMEWRTIAQQRDLRYHSWIDDYADAVGAPAGKAAPDAMKNTTSKADEPTPGKMPRTAIGKLAIKAAWQIECETKGPAIVDAVIQMLQEWVEREDELLEKIKGGVSWQTKGCKAKNFDIEACTKALERWHKSRP